MNTVTKRAFCLALAVCALMLAIVSQVHATVVGERQFLEVNNYSEEEVIVLVPPKGLGLDLVEVGRVPGRSYRRMPDALAPGGYVIVLEFTADGSTVRTTRQVVGNHGLRTFYFGKRLTIDRDRSVTAKSVQFYDGFWRIEGNNQISQLRLEHVDGAFAGSIDAPRTAKAMPMQGTVDGQNVSFTITHPDEPEAGGISAQLVASDDFRSLKGTIMLTVIYEGRKYTTSNALVMTVDAPKKQLIVKSLIPQR